MARALDGPEKGRKYTENDLREVARIERKLTEYFRFLEQISNDPITAARRESLKKDMRNYPIYDAALAKLERGELRSARDL